MCVGEILRQAQEIDVVRSNSEAASESWIRGWAGMTMRGIPARSSLHRERGVGGGPVLAAVQRAEAGGADVLHDDDGENE